MTSASSVTNSLVDMKCSNISHLHVPQYKGLSIEAILKWAKKDDPSINEYLPAEIDQPKLARQWVMNLCYTILGRPFANFITMAIEDRNEKLTTKHDLMINLDPEVAKAFHA